MEAMSVKKYNRCIKELEKLKNKLYRAEYKVDAAEKYLHDVKLDRRKARSKIFEFESRLQNVIIQKSDGTTEFNPLLKTI